MTSTVLIVQMSPETPTGARCHRPGCTGGDVTFSHHAALLRNVVLGLIGRPLPGTTAVAVAVMLAEEGADAIGAEVCHTVFALLGQDDRVGQDNCILIHASLKITQDVVSARNVVGEVR